MKRSLLTDGQGLPLAVVLDGAKRHAGAKARRWVVERSHSWLNRFRAVLIR